MLTVTAVKLRTFVGHASLIHVILLLVNISSIIFLRHKTNAGTPNDFNHIIYEKEGHKLEQFTIDVFGNYIQVNVPIGNTNYAYSVKFTDYFKAQEFMLMHLTLVEEGIKEKYAKTVQ